MLHIYSIQYHLIQILTASQNSKNKHMNKKTHTADDVIWNNKDKWCIMALMENSCYNLQLNHFFLKWKQKKNSLHRKKTQSLREWRSQILYQWISCDVFQNENERCWAENLLQEIHELKIVYYLSLYSLCYLLHLFPQSSCRTKMWYCPLTGGFFCLEAQLATVYSMYSQSVACFLPYISTAWPKTQGK